MSLSPEPQAKITPLTAKEICDDIWAGTIHYAKSAGMDMHPLITTAIWTGLVLSVRNKLEGFSLLDDVLNLFIPTFSKIYDIGLDKVEILANLKQTQQDLWADMCEEQGTLNDPQDISIFVHNLIALHEDLDKPFTMKSPSECTNLLKTTMTLVAAHVDNIVYQVDNEMLLQFQDARTNLYSPAQKTQTQHTNERLVKYEEEKREKETNSQVAKVLIFLFLAFIFLMWLVLQPNSDDSAASTQQATNKPTTSQVQKMEALPRPRSGKILKGNSNGESKITITASTDDDYVVSLKTAGGDLKLAFYVRAGDTVTVNVPRKKLYVYFASGDEWYGYGIGKMFGEDTVYSKDDEILDFTNYTWEYTLYPVTNGNFSETPIDEDDFF